VQNKLEDLFSLTQFLRFHPLENYVNARKYVLEPLGRQDSAAVTNLRLAFQTIALRRTKNASGSISREKVVMDVNLTPSERRHYISIRDRVRHLSLSSKASQSHALLLCILYLRQLCSHGRPTSTPSPNQTARDPSGPLSCDRCGDCFTVPPKLTSQEHRTCGHEICTECRLEEKTATDCESSSVLPAQCCICQEPIISTVAKGNAVTLESLLGETKIDAPTGNLETTVSSKIQCLIDKLIEIDLQSNLESGEPIKR